MQGQPIGFDVEGRPEMLPFVEKVGRVLLGVPIKFKQYYRDKPNAEPYSDYLTFMLMGIPAIQPISGLPDSIYKYYHTTKDSISLIEKNQMNATVVVMTFMLYKLANAAQLSASRMNVEQTEGFFHTLNGAKVLLPEYNWQLRKQLENNNIK